MSDRRDDFGDREDAEFSIRPAIQTLWSYRQVILLALATTVVAFVAVALIMYAVSPRETVASISFRLTFEGAEDDRYPNGTKFSSAEIIATSVLEEVYRRNELKTYATFQAFKESMFILHSNPDLEMLAYEYQGKLSDSRLTPVDRARIEEEFHKKRESLKSPAYSLNMRRLDGVVRIPSNILAKVLQDTLSTWAQQAADRKGATKYNIAILSKNSLKMDAYSNADFVIGVDMLRNALERVLKSIEDIAQVPGAEAVRLAEDQMSLADVRARSEDLIRFGVEPLLGTIRTNGLSRDGARPDVYFSDRLFEVQLKREEIRQRMASLQQALNSYQKTAGPGTAPVPSEGRTSGGVTPQVSESFIDRLVQLSTQSEDVEYRQDLTNRIIVDGAALADLTRQVDYYESMRKAFASTRSSRHAALEGEVTRRTKELQADVGKTMDRVEALYKLISQQNLNPDAVVYSVTAPFTTRTTSALPARTVAVYFLLTMLAALIVFPLACLAHEYFRHWVAPSGTKPGSGTGAARSTHVAGV
jgi:hypothetical protein